MHTNHKVVMAALLFSISGAIFLSCTSKTDTQPNTEANKQADTGMAAMAKPEYGGWGVDLAGMDKSIKPGDDFYSYVNGTWSKNAVIADDKPAEGSFLSLNDRAQDELKKMIKDIGADKTAAEGSNEQKIRDFYLSMMDEEKLKSLGLQPIESALAAIGKLSDRGALQDMLAKNQSDVGAAPMELVSGFDTRVVGKMLLTISTRGMALPAREMYLEQNYEPIRDAFRAHLIEVFKLIGSTTPETSADHVIKLETAIAGFTWTKTQLRDPIKKFNPMSIQQLGEIAPGIDWKRFLTMAGVGSIDTVNASTKSSIAGMAKLIASAPMEEWQDYLRYHEILGAQYGLAKQYRDVFFDFFGKQLSGQKQELPRWKIAIATMGGRGQALVDALGEEFVKRYVSPESRPTLRKIVKNILTAFDNRLKNVPWMTPETRNAARDKLAKTTIKVIYPDIWIDNSDLQVVKDDAVGNLRHAKEYLFKRELKWIEKEPDHRVFFNSVYAINAYANPDWNEIVFLAAIVRPPFFDPAADPAVNYGAMGAVIGHEISHLFDDQGRLYDGDGLLHDWWNPEDAKQFVEVTNRLARQVETYEPLPGKHMNGKLVLGESIADVAGLTVAYDAYKLSLGDKPAEEIDGYSGEQRFFLGYAQAWRFKGRDAYVDRLLKIDPHPTSNFRPLTVRNLDAWYKAFDVKPGERLYLDPKDRVNPW